MPSSFLSPLAAPAHTASSTAKASDLLDRQGYGPGQDFGQALARSVSNAQHNTRREQAALEAKSMEARRVDANRAEANSAQADRKQQADPSHSPKKSGAERVSKQDKPDKAHHAGKDQGEELQSQDPSSAALGVLDWLGGQVKAQALGRGGDDVSVQAGDLLAAGKGHSGPAHAAPIDEAQANTQAAALGAQAGAEAGLEVGASAGDSQLASRPDALQIASAFAKPGAGGSGAGSAALSKPDPQAASNQAGAQAFHNPEALGLQGLESQQASTSAAGAQAWASSSSSSASAAEVRPGAALGADNKRGPAARSGPRAAPGAMAQAGLAPLSQPAVSKAVASFASSTSASASSSASAKAEAFGSAGPNSTAPAAESRPALASKAGAAGNSPGTGDAFTSLALDTSNAQAASDAPATPAPAQAVGHWGQLEPEVGTPAWQQALNQQILQMRRGHANEAELQLNPLGLGPLRIKLSLREQELNAEFSAAHAQVREALEAALPQLREALQQSGIQLGQAVVDTAAQNGQNGQNGQNSQSGSTLASSGFAGSGAPGQDSSNTSSRGQNLSPSPQPLRNAALDALAGQSPRQSPGTNTYGPGQRLNTFA